MPKTGRRERASEWLHRLDPVAHPILFALYPLLALFAHNQSEIELGVLWLPLGLTVAVASALYGVFLLVFRRGAKAGVLASIAVGAFFYYGIFADKFTSAMWFAVLWVAVFALASVVVARTSRSLRSLTLILVAAAAVLVVGPVARIAVYQRNHPGITASDPSFWPARLAPPRPSPGAHLPDIYVLVPDDYGRADVLKRYFGYDATPFVRQLEKRGFVVAQQARSPYSDSEMNIAAEVNMDYLSRLPSILGKDSQDVRPVRRLIADNRTARLLKPLGYRYLHLDSDEVTFPAGNPDISPVATEDSFMTLWLQQSILRRVGGPIGFDDRATNARFRNSVLDAFSRLNASAFEPGPTFVLFHTLIPHDPYVFGPKGEHVTFPDTSGEGHSSRLGMQYYLKQLRFTEAKLLEATDAILARSKEPPVIVIVSDEGFEGSEEVLGEDTMRDIRVKGIAAFHLPGASAAPPADLNTVNTMRYVFNETFGTNYPLLENASYAEADAPYVFEELEVR